MKHWDIFYEQLATLKKSELYNDASEIYLNVCIEKDKVEKLKDIIRFGFEKIQLYNVVHENQFEYPGLDCLFKTATEDSVSLYFHTKGIYEQKENSNKARRFLMKHLITEYKIATAYLKDYDKVACFVSEHNICWFNFYWITGNALKKRIPPTEVSKLPLTKKNEINRWIYELWSANTEERTKSLCFDRHIEPNELNAFINTL